MSRRPAAELLVACLLFGPATVRAHDLWIEPEAGGYRLLYGHHPQVSHGGARQIPYAAEVVRSVVCLDAAGGRRAAKTGGAPVRIEGDCAVLYVLTSSGYWTKTPAGTRNVRKTEAVSPLNAWQSFESVKHLTGWGPGAAGAIGAPLEIVPAQDPFSLRDGDKLGVRVLADGKPVAGAVVRYDGKPRGETGADGSVNVRVRRGGLQLIQASVRTPHTGPDADEVVHTTALSFDLGPAR